MAPRDILPGVDWGGAIVDAINASTVMVLVYSARANDSPQIKREVERAVHRGLPIIPFRIEDVPMSKTLEYLMSMPHWLDALTPPLQDHLDRLAETTRLILERAGPVLPPPPRGSATESPPVVQPLTTSRGIAREIGRWAIGGTESPTLAAVFVPGSDRIANAALIAASVVAIAILAQMHVGPIWLQPLAVLVTGAALGSRRGALAAAIYVGLGILGLPVFARGVSAWTSVNYSAPYVRYGLGYLAGLIAAAFAVGWLSERRAWDRHRANAARLALAGIALFYLPGSLLAGRCGGRRCKSARAGSRFEVSVPGAARVVSRRTIAGVPVGALFQARNLFVVNVEDGSVRQVTRYETGSEGPTSQSWLPDGRRLLVSYWAQPRAQLAGSDLGILDVESGEITRLTMNTEENFNSASLSLDGTRAIARASREEREVWTVPMAPIRSRMAAARNDCWTPTSPPPAVRACVLWIETAALLMREPRAPAGVLPSISMLVITAAVLTYGLPRAWVAALSLHRRSESPSAAVPAQTAPTETTHTRPPYAREGARRPGDGQRALKAIVADPASSSPGRESPAARSFYSPASSSGIDRRPPRRIPRPLTDGAGVGSRRVRQPSKSPAPAPVRCG